MRPRILLDTNVVSELFRPLPDPQVVAFLEASRTAVLPVVVIYELEYGLARMPAGRRRDRLGRFIGETTRVFQHRILDLTPRRARESAFLRAEAERAGRILPEADSLVAGIARADDLILATRNLRHFEGLGIELLNPWEETA